MFEYDTHAFIDLLITQMWQSQVNHIARRFSQRQQETRETFGDTPWPARVLNKLALGEDASVSFLYNLDTLLKLATLTLFNILLVSACVWTHQQGRRLTQP